VKLTGKTVVVTTEGIGLTSAFIKALRAAGASVIVTGRDARPERYPFKNPDSSVADPVCIEMDPTDAESCRRGLLQAHAVNGRLDAVCCLAV